MAASHPSSLARFSLCRYCHVNVPDELLRDLLPGPVTLVLKRSEELNKDLNPFTSVGLCHGTRLCVFDGRRAVFRVRSFNSYMFLVWLVVSGIF